MARVGKAKRADQQESCAIRHVKTCGHCHRPLFVEVGITFTRNKSMPDGLQINCRECDERHKAEDPNYAWRAFARIFARENPGDFAKWTRADYHRLVCIGTRLGECDYCGNDLRLWGKGHKIDRIDSKRGHTPDNCRPCCSGCNWAKGSQDPNAWAHQIADILSRYPRGKVPWQTINPKGPAPVRIDDLSPYIANHQLDFRRMVGG